MFYLADAGVIAAADRSTPRGTIAYMQELVKEGSSESHEKIWRDCLTKQSRHTVMPGDIGEILSGFKGRFGYRRFLAYSTVEDYTPYTDQSDTAQVRLSKEMLGRMIRVIVTLYRDGDRPIWRIDFEDLARMKPDK